MTLTSSAYYSGDPVFASEYLAGSELNADITWKFHGSPAGFRGEVTMDNLAFWAECLTIAECLQLSGGTLPNALV